MVKNVVDFPKRTNTQGLEIEIGKIRATEIEGAWGDGETGGNLERGTLPIAIKNTAKQMLSHFTLEVGCYDFAGVLVAAIEISGYSDVPPGEKTYQETTFHISRADIEAIDRYEYRLARAGWTILD